MSTFRIRFLSGVAVVGLLLSAAPAHAVEATSNPSVVTADLSDRIPRLPLPRNPCWNPAPPPGWVVPLYCQIGPSLPLDLAEIRANPIVPTNPMDQHDPADPKHYTGTYQPQV